MWYITFTVTGRSFSYLFCRLESGWWRLNGSEGNYLTINAHKTYFYLPVLYKPFPSLLSHRLFHCSHYIALDSLVFWTVGVLIDHSIFGLDKCNFCVVTFYCYITVRYYFTVIQLIFTTDNSSNLQHGGTYSLV